MSVPLYCNTHQESSPNALCFRKGNAYIYPVVDWSEPSTTILVVFLTTLLLLSLHLVSLGLSVARDQVTSRCVRGSVTARADEGMPLRQPGMTNV